MENPHSTSAARKSPIEADPRQPVPLGRGLRPTSASPLRSAGEAERRRLRRLEQDLHDGVQNELVALIVQLAGAQEDPDTPPALAEMLAGLEARAQAALDSVREIARGIYPAVLFDLGLAAALRAQAARAPIHVTLIGTAPRGPEEAEEAVYFGCSEAIQNAAKHAGPTARVKLRLHHHRATLTARISDDGRGYDQARTPTGVGLESIQDRIGRVGGTFELASKPGRGTVVTISLPWPPLLARRQ
jgi:signal transduction histidine kinase